MKPLVIILIIAVGYAKLLHFFLTGMVEPGRYGKVKIYRSERPLAYWFWLIVYAVVVIGVSIILCQILVRDLAG